jgi:ribonuclease VapC
MLLSEPEAERLVAAAAGDDRRLASAFTVLETGVVVEARKGAAAGRELELLLSRLEVDVVPLTASLADVAQDAWRRFGKGNHPARLNIGDCCSYALAKTSGEPLLCKGENFPRTDIERVAY